VELRDAFEVTPDLKIVWVMSDAQINERTRAFIGELGLASHVLFLADPKSRLIRELGILKEDPEPIEMGVPHPTTLVVDGAGIVQFVDVRRDFHFWLDPDALTEVLTRLEPGPTDR
jgi:peroxiredoxin